GAPRSRANHKTKYRVGVALLDTQLRKSDAPHRKEIGAPYRFRVAGFGRSIRSIVRAAQRRPGGSARPRSPEDPATHAQVAEAPAVLVAREMRVAVQVRRFPRWQCFAAKRCRQAPRAAIRAPFRLTTSIATATPSEFPPAENIYR